MAFIIDDIILAPVNMVTWIGDKLLKAAEGELSDDSKVQAELLDLQIRRELEEIDEDKYLTEEAGLLERLDAINRFKESM